MFAKIMFEVDGTKHPTDDGRYLHINSGNLVGNLSLNIDPKDDSDELPTDVISSNFRIADSAGNVWSMQSRFTSELFLIHMIDLSLSEPGLFRPSNADDKYTKAFEECLMLENVRFSSDDRFYRHFSIDNELISVQFHYTTISFDIAVLQDEDEEDPLLTKLALRVNSGSLFSDGEDIGSFGFIMSIEHLLRSNTAVYSEDYRCWKNSPIPLPCLFHLTQDKSNPQDNVIIKEN